MRETHSGDAGDRPLQFALRETQQGFLSLKQWSVLLALIVVLMVSGPFQTLQTLDLPQRTAFWAVMVVGGIAVGDFVASLCRLVLIRRDCPQPYRALITGLAAGIAILPIALAVEWVTFGSDIFDAVFILKNAGYTILIGIVVASVVSISLSKRTTAETSPQEETTCRLLQRLAFEKRGELISDDVPGDGVAG